tara:strand:- start:78 stop:488 length:411 start_codon:yes stop_codon:yes gene_type:complete
MRRVVSPLTGPGVDPVDVADLFRRGKNFIGDGVYGRGTYTVEGTAAEFEAYASRVIPNAYAQGEVLEMTLLPEARIYEFVSDARKEGLKLLEEYAHLGFDEPHQVLAALGYDAVRYIRTTESFVVVLNRTKVVVGA